MFNFGHDIYSVDNFFYEHLRLKELVLDYVQKSDFYSITKFTLISNGIPEESGYTLVKRDGSELSKLLIDLHLSINDLMNSVYQESFTCQWNNREYVCAIGCHPSGGFFPPHYDFGSSGKEYYKCSSVFYLNENYDGGSLYFPEHNVEIAAKENQLIMLPSHYLHASSEVKNGTKFYIGTFFYGQDQ